VAGLSRRQLAQWVCAPDCFRARSNGDALALRRSQFARVSHDDPIPVLKRQLGEELARLVVEWNIDDIAYMIGTDRARISDLRAIRLERFSLERLVRFLARLDYWVEITVVEARFARRERSPTKSE